jgi:hypothetical protein
MEWTCAVIADVMFFPNMFRSDLHKMVIKGSEILEVLHQIPEVRESSLVLNLTRQGWGETLLLIMEGIFSKVVL